MSVAGFSRREFLEPRLPPRDEWLWLPALLASGDALADDGSHEPVGRVAFDRPPPLAERPSTYSPLARLRLGVRALSYVLARRFAASGRLAIEALVVAIVAGLGTAWILSRKAFDLGDEGFLYLVAAMSWLQ